MKKYRIENFTRGWLVGDFEPSIIRTKEFELMLHYYKAGDTDKKHVHKIAPEITVFVSGKFSVNNETWSAGDVMELGAGEPMTTDFICLEDGATVALKVPSVMGDKYLL